MSPDGEAGRLAEAVARRSYGKLVAFLAARTRDVAAAEDALSDAFAAALAEWPRSGCPANPEAWLLTVARRKTIDAARRAATREAAASPLARLGAAFDAAEAETDLPDRRLGLMLACAHPAIEAGVRAPLMLQMVVGLDAATIAAAFLVSPSAMAKRLARAKSRIREAGIPFRVPGRADLPARVGAVLDTAYAAYSEGWSDPGGTDAARRDLRDEGVFLARLLAELLPEDAEALGLLSLMLHTEARRAARRNAAGEYVPFAEQDTRRWDWVRIEEAERLLLRASRLGRVGRYQLEAALQSAHVLRRHTGVANWGEVVALYDALRERTGSPVVAVNRALAIAEATGPKAGLDALSEVVGDPRLAEYQPYWAARGELLARTGEPAEACRAFDVAIGLERDPAVRRFLQGRRPVHGKGVPPALRRDDS